MVSIIKNQIFKHLSKFTKDLKSDQFNFSTLKGEGKLTDLTLEETVLTDLLELPSWLKLTSAICNQVEFRIQWAKLKSVPIYLRLDEVKIEVVTCEELRSTSSSQGLSSYAGAAKYNFIHKVIDGITVDVNTVYVTFKSPAFTSTVELSRINVESKSPDWKQVELPQTRVKDPAKEHVLLFKELKWQNAKIEARSLNDATLTPLRLITNGASCRIVLKKRIKDSCIMGSRMVVRLDDILWVLTDMQMKATLHFLDSLSGLIQKATEIGRKRKAARKLEVLPEFQAQQTQHARVYEQPNANQKPMERFGAIDVVETSYHFLADKIELHFSDDNSDGRSTYPELQKGAVLQISLVHFQVDFYPYHLAVASRGNWPMYQEGNSMDWLRSAHNKFTADLLASAQNNCQFATKNDDASPTGLTADQARQFILNQLAKLMTSCFILRLADFTVYQVTTAASAKRPPIKLISGDREKFKVPVLQPIFQAEFTYYYYPTDAPFPTPTPKLFVSVNPIQVHFDVSSILWLNAFGLSLQQSLLMTSAAGNDAMVSAIMSFDVHINAINTRVVFEAKEEYAGQRDRPQSLQIQISRARISNVRFTENGFRTDLEAAINAFRLGSLFYNSRFPSDPQDLKLKIESFSRFCEIAEKTNHSPITAVIDDDVRNMLNHMPNTDRKDLWCVSLDSISGCFYGARAVGKEHAVAFLDNLPVTLWVNLQVLPVLDIQVMASMSSLVSLQVNHYQFLFLLRLSERLEELANHLADDSSRILKKPSDVSIVIGAILPQVDITLLMPSQTPGKSSSGGDMESFIPDSSSLQDDNWQSSSSAAKTSEEHIHFSDPTINELPAANGFVRTTFPLQKPSNEFDNKEPRRLSVGRISLSDETATSALKGFRNAFRKGVGELMASLDMTAGNQSPDDMSSSISLQSDPSIDGDGFIPDGKNSLFFTGVITDVEEATECLEDNTVTSPSEKDSFCNSLKRHDLVSICTFKLKRVEVQFQIQGAETLAKVEISSVCAGECPSIPWDEFQADDQNKFISRHRGSCEPPLVEPGPRQIALRMKRPESKINSHPVAEIDARIQAIRLCLSASSIAGIAELVEDELRPKPIPAKILLEDIRLQIVDDRPLPHITSMEPPPVDIAIRHLLVRRDMSGLIEIPAPIPVYQQLRPVDGEALMRLQAENEDLRRRLAALERLTEENYRLKRYQEETEQLRPSLQTAQDSVDKLLNEKKHLLDKLELLKNQLTQSERTNKR